MNLINAKALIKEEIDRLERTLKQLDMSYREAKNNFEAASQSREKNISKLNGLKNDLYELDKIDK